VPLELQIRGGNTIGPPRPEPSLEPTPRRWLEKFYDSGIANLVPPLLMFLVAFDPLRQALGWLPAFVITVVAGVALGLVISLPVVPLKKQRAKQDAERGIVECVHREKGSTLRGRWATGYAKAEPGRLLFQAKTGQTGPLYGSVEIYIAPRPLGKPVKAPFSVFPRGEIMAFATDKGEVELAAAPSSLKLLTELTTQDGH